MRHKILYFVFFACVGLFFVSCSYLQKGRDMLKGAPSILGSDDVSGLSGLESNAGSDSGNIKGLSTVYFNLDSSDLREDVKEVLRANKDWIDSNSKVKQVILEGHCDPLGSEAYNIGLGERRAQSVYQYLISIGVDSDKLSTMSYGEEKIFSPSDNSLNRRVNFVPQY